MPLAGGLIVILTPGTPMRIWFPFPVSISFPTGIYFNAYIDITLSPTPHSTPAVVYFVVVVCAGSSDRTDGVVIMSTSLGLDIKYNISGGIMI